MNEQQTVIPASRISPVRVLRIENTDRDPYVFGVRDIRRIDVGTPRHGTLAPGHRPVVVELLDRRQMARRSDIHATQIRLCPRQRAGQAQSSAAY